MNKTSTNGLDVTAPAAPAAPVASARPAKKALGFTTMIAICIGVVVVQGAMMSALQGLGFGGLGFIAAFAVAFILAQCYVQSFAELSLMFPQAGTLATYTQKAIGHFPAIVAVFAGYVIVAMFGLSAELLLVDAILDKLFPGVFPATLVPLSILVVLTALNILGTDVFAKLQNVFTFAMVAALLLVGLSAVGGLAEAPAAGFVPDVNWGWDGILDGSFIGLVALAMWLLVGAEFICPLIGEVRQPERNIPRSMTLSLTITFTLFVIFCVGASRYLSVETLTTSPLPYLDYVFAVFGKGAVIIATVMALTATCSTVNTVLAAVPRMLCGMAENGQAFPQMKVLHKRFGTPWMAIVFVAIIIALPFLLMGPDSIITLLIAASTSWLLAYIIAHVNVMVLRRRQPHLPRPYKSALYPLPQIVGILGMGYIALNNSPSPEMTQTVYLLTGAVLGLVGLIALAWVKLVMKRKLFEPDI